MKDLKQLARHSLRNIGSAATKRVIKQFANKYQLVYFGHVDPQEDEYELVRGLTVSTTHVDNHYTVGSYNSHDIILLERRNTLTFPGKPDTTYRWLILQVDLKHGGLPHIFIDSRHHDAMFYANAFMVKGGMQDMSGYFSNMSAAFAEKCKIFASPTAYNEVGILMQPKIADAIAQHFSQFDYEFFEDRVLVYANNNVATPPLLDDMLRIGIWLAEEFNSVQL
jgi:hypothetical protein